jgi:Cupin
VVLDPSGASEINNYGPGDLWFFPKGHGHSIQTIGDKPCHFVLSFDNGAFSEHGTFSITDWIDVTPKDMLALNFGVPKDIFDAFPKGEIYIQAGPVVPASEAPSTRPGPRSRRTNSACCTTTGPCATSRAARSASRRSMSGPSPRACQAA